MDIYPTLAEAAGFEIPSHLDGTSLVPMVKDQDIQRGPVVSSYNFKRNESVNGHAVRSENYRYIYYPRVGLEELYDHRTDPNEWNNVAYRDENQEAVEQHRKILRERFPDLDLTWEEGVPDGFELTDDGSIRKTEFTPMSEVTSTN
jgi:arylsulfatase A-like enzyme